MAHITVGFAQMQEVQQTLSDISNQVFQASSDFQAVMRRVDWEVKSKSDIESRARRLTHKLEDCRTASRNYSAFVNTAYVKYAELENYQRGLANVGNITLFPSGVAVNGFSRNGEQKTEEEQTVKAKSFWEMLAEFYWKGHEQLMSHIDELLSWIKSLLEKGKHAASQEALGMVADVIGLFEDIIDTVKDISEEKFNLSKTITKLGEDILDILLGLVDMDKYGIVNKLISIVSELLDAIKTGIEDGIDKMLSELDSLIESVGSAALKLATTPVARGIIYTVSTVATFLSRLVGDCMNFNKDGSLDWKEMLQALGNGILSGSGTLVNLVTRGLIDFDVDSDGKIVFN